MYFVENRVGPITLCNGGVLTILSEAEKLRYCLERDRLLCSAEFARSPTMSKLLRFLVDCKLLDEGKPLTAYAVAVEGLGRDDSFDTQIDSYPRVQIGRLRRMLDHFYLREKSEYRLFIPYQHYEIILGKNETASEAQPGSDAAPGPAAESDTSPVMLENSATRSPGHWRSIGSAPLLAIIAGLIMLAGAAYYFLQGTSGEAPTAIAYPSVIVQPAEGTTDSPSRARIESAQSYLVGALGKFDQLHILDEDAGSARGSQYFLETSVLNGTANRIQLRLVAADTSEVIWSDRVETTSAMQESDLDRAVVEIAGSYGKIAQHELSKHRGDYTPGYPCLLQFHQFMRFRDVANLESVLQCMDASARKYPDDAYLMSMLAIAKNIAKLFGVEDQIEGAGKDFALRAARLDSDSASATFAVAQSAFYEGDCRRGASWGERAVSLNPLNSRIMGYLGIYMLACKMPEGEAYATRALELDANADPAIAATVAMQKLRRGEAQAAQALSSRYMDSVPGAAVGLEISYILSSAMLGEKEEARKAWRLLAERSGLPETAEPRAVLSKWIGNPVLLRELETDFQKADLY